MQGRRKKKTRLAILLTVLTLFIAGCVTVGRPFPPGAVSRLKIGETTQKEVEHLFGSPWRTGLEDGKRTWTYAHYRYTVLGGSMTRDLVVRFNAKGLVDSYSFNSTYPEDTRP